MIEKILERASKFNLLIDQYQIESIKKAIDEVQRNFPNTEAINFQRSFPNAPTEYQKNFLNFVPLGTEIELRFGSKERDYFKTGMDGYTFLRIYELLSLVIEFPRMEHTKVESYDNFRVITYLDDTYEKYSKNSMRNKKVFERKDTLKKIDVDTSPYAMRLSIAKETKIMDPQTKTQPRYSKIQKRYFFSFYYFQIHLSEIMEKNNKKYEMEIEIRAIDKLLESIKLGYMLLTENISLISDEVRQNIISTQYSITKLYPKIKTDKKKLMFDNKPYSLGFSNIDKIKSGFVVTNKLDGVHYNLVFTNYAAYLINSTNVMMISHNRLKPYESFWNDTLGKNIYVLDGELVFDPKEFKYNFYVFDSVVLKNQDVSFKPYLERMGSDASSIVEKYNASQLNPLLGIKMKQLFYSNNTLKDIKDCFNYIKGLYGEDYKEKDDGLVFIQNDGKFNDIIYKWKYPERITIDGKIRFEKDTEKYSVYKFSFKTESGYAPIKNECGELFLYADKNEMISSMLTNGLIVEGKFLPDVNGFIPTRVRTDKIEPNFITIAEKTFQEIINPLDENQLLAYFDKSEKKPQSDQASQKPKQEVCKTSSVIQEQEQTERKNALSSLKVDKVSKLPVYFSNEKFVRIGMIGEGSCFVHSILFAIYAEKYREMDENTRMKYAALIRKKMADALQIQRWASLGKGNIAMLSTEIELYKNIPKDQEKEMQDYMRNFSPSSEDVYKDYIVYVKKKYPDILKITNKVFEAYKNKLRGCEFFDLSMIEYASIFFDINILIVRDITRVVDKNIIDLYKADKNTVFVLNIDAKFREQGAPHYECMGVIENGELNTIFDNDSKAVTDALSYYKEMEAAIDEGIEEVLRDMEEEEEPIPEEEIEEKVVEEEEVKPKGYKVDLEKIQAEVREIRDKYFIIDKSKEINISVQ